MNYDEIDKRANDFADKHKNKEADFNAWNLLHKGYFSALEEEQVKKLNIDGISKRSITDNYEREKYANEKAANEIKEFCEYVMHPQSDLHQDAKEWIDSRLK